MEDLFRFVALRAPQRSSPDEAVDLTTGSAFQRDLTTIHTEPSPPPPPPPAGSPG